MIAFLDASDDQHQRAIDLLRPRLATGDRMILAASVYAEILVHPLKRGTDQAIDEFITAIGADVIAIDRDIARRAAQLRASDNALRLPDALTLATALATGADLLTLDQRLLKIASKHTP
ncbi:MAG: PIN domain-containing protein [Actinomycetota bacterium]|nr:PIN domain-containing protein [Actinomycetota bacterium]